MAESELPLYINSDGDEEIPSPYTFQDLGIRFFPVMADVDSLQAVCDKFLNIAPPDKLEYRPLGGMVFLQINTYKVMRSDVKPFSDYGFFTENELTFTMLVAKGRQIRGEFIAESFAFFMPYLFVDAPWAAASGREIFGYPKALSRFRIPEDIKNPAPTTVETMVFPIYSPETLLSWQPLLEITQHPGAEPQAEKVFDSFAGFFQEARELLFGSDGLLGELDLELLAHFVSAGLKMEFPVVSLKQFRDAENPEEACYQALVGITLKITDFKGAGFLLGGYRGHLQAYDSEPIARVLGLETSKDGTLDFKLPSWLLADWSFQDMRNLYVATP